MYFCETNMFCTFHFLTFFFPSHNAPIHSEQTEMPSEEQHSETMYFNDTLMQDCYLWIYNDAQFSMPKYFSKSHTQTHTL